MLCARKVAVLLTALLVALAPPAFAAEEFTSGGSCSGTNTAAFDWDTGWQCITNAWAHAPLFVGSASAYTCNSTNAGVVQYTGSLFEGCDGSNWNIAVPPVVNAGSSTSIDWSTGTTQYTTASCGAFTFTNMLDGNTYQLFVEGTTSGTCSFSQSGLTFKLPSNFGATTASTMTVLSFTRAGSNVFVAWIPGY